MEDLIRVLKQIYEQRFERELIPTMDVARYWKVVGVLLKRGQIKKLKYYNSLRSHKKYTVFEDFVDNWTPE